MHFIQKKIIDSLRQEPNQRYSEMMVEGVESGHFRYHLHELEKRGFVEKKERGKYKLTSNGKSFLDTTSLNKVLPESSPKVITYTLLESKGQIFLHRKDKEPYLGLLNMVGGKVHVGESTSKASVREVEEKAGLDISNPDFRGVFEVVITKDGMTYTHAIAFVYSKEITKQDVASSSSLELVKDPVNSKVLAPDFISIYQEISKDKVGGKLIEIEYM